MAYCGMAAALSVALMLLGAVVPVLMFIAPAVHRPQPACSSLRSAWSAA